MSTARLVGDSIYVSMTSENPVKIPLDYAKQFLNLMRTRFLFKFNRNNFATFLFILLSILNVTMANYFGKSSTSFAQGYAG